MQPEAWEMGACNACLVSPECLAPALFLERIKLSDLEQVYEKGFLSENERCVLTQLISPSGIEV